MISKRLKEACKTVKEVGALVIGLNAIVLGVYFFSGIHDKRIEKKYNRAIRRQIGYRLERYDNIRKEIYSPKSFENSLDKESSSAT